MLSEYQSKTSVTEMWTNYYTLLELGPICKIPVHHDADFGYYWYNGFVIGHDGTSLSSSDKKNYVFKTREEAIEGVKKEIADTKEKILELELFLRGYIEEVYKENR
jgi:hypothetical protein